MGGAIRRHSHSSPVAVAPGHGYDENIGCDPILPVVPRSDAIRATQQTELEPRAAPTNMTQRPTQRSPDHHPHHSPPHPTQLPTPLFFFFLD